MQKYEILHTNKNKMNCKILRYGREENTEAS